MSDSSSILYFEVGEFTHFFTLQSLNTFSCNYAEWPQNMFSVSGCWYFHKRCS
jgi:hypothetical protein